MLLHFSEVCYDKCASRKPVHSSPTTKIGREKVCEDGGIFGMRQVLTYSSLIRTQIVLAMARNRNFKCLGDFLVTVPMSFLWELNGHFDHQNVELKSCILP